MHYYFRMLDVNIHYNCNLTSRKSNLDKNISSVIIDYTNQCSKCINIKYNDYYQYKIIQTLLKFREAHQHNLL